MRLSRRAVRLSAAGFAALWVASTALGASIGPQDLHPLSLATGGALVSVIEGASALALNPGGIAGSGGFSAQFLFGAAPVPDTSVQISARFASDDGLSAAAALERRNTALVVDAGFALMQSRIVASGIGIRYDSAYGSKGVTAGLGVQYRNPLLRVGAHVRALSLDLLDGVGHIEGAASVELPLRDLVGLAFGLTTAGGRYELGVGAEILLFGLRLRWGGAVDLAGGVSRVGGGIRVDLTALSIYAAAGLVRGQFLASIAVGPSVPPARTRSPTPRER